MFQERKNLKRNIIRKIILEMKIELTEKNKTENVML